MIRFFIDVFNDFLSADAIIHRDNIFNYGWLKDRIAFWKSEISMKGIQPSQVIALNGDFTPNSIAILFALIDNRNIIVPFDYQQIGKNRQKLEIACAQRAISVDENDNVVFEEFGQVGSHPFL